MTNADKLLEEQVNKLLAEAPKLTIMVAAERRHRSLQEGRANDAGGGRLAAGAEALGLKS